jgi:hypothetical protein
MRKIVVILFALVLALLRPQVHAQVLSNVYGINTMTSGALDDTQKQLNWAKALTGQNGHVKQLFYSITQSTTGPSQAAKDYVNEAYKRGLDPVLRLEGNYDQSTGWVKPVPDGTGTAATKYTKVAAGFKKFVSGLPRVTGRTLFIEVWNEPNLNHEWSGAANVKEYSRFFVDTAAAIHAIGDSRIKVLNAGLSPGGDIDNLQFIQQAITADSKFKTSYDVWAAHPYARNVPPEINLHNKTAPANSRDTIDSYLLELNVLKNNGVNTTSVKVLATEAGYRLYDSWYSQYPAIDDAKQADYTKRAFENYWSKWPELISVMPFQLSDGQGTWWDMDWIYPSSTTDANNFPTQPHLQYARTLRGVGIIQGVVKDSNGNPIKDVTITTNLNGHKAITRADGSYIMIVFPGTYLVTAAKEGFPSSTIALVVTLTNTSTINFTINTGSTNTLPMTVQNPSFETGDLTNWNFFGAVDGVQTGTWFTGITAYDGNYFFGTAANWGSKNGGLYQRLGATPGRTQTLSAWIRTYVEGTDTNGNRIGIDPLGGTDPNSANIVWSAYQQSPDMWRQLTVSTPAQSDIVTVYLQFQQSNANVWNINAFDLVEKSEL